MRLDLHVHSTASDGLYSPTYVVERALGKGLQALSITDHDSISGIDEARRAAVHTHLQLIPGVELSTIHKNRDVHILGYFIDTDDLTLSSKLEKLRSARFDRAREIVGALQSSGFELTLDDVVAVAGTGSVGRAHIARTLVTRGHATDISDAFRRFLGREQPFYAPKPVDEPSAVIETIQNAGGVPVLAHPGVTQVDDAIPELVDAGLLGLEAYHAEHSAQMRHHYARMARDLGLLVTGGSDFHGLSSRSADLGSVRMPADVVEHLAEAAKRAQSRT